MGEVVDFKRRFQRNETRKREERSDEDFETFCQYYVDHLAEANDLTLSVVIEAAKVLDIGKPNDYDIFMLRETLMSMKMRSIGLYHPLHNFTDDYVEAFGEEEAFEG